MIALKETSILNLPKELTVQSVQIAFNRTILVLCQSSTLQKDDPIPSILIHVGKGGEEIRRYPLPERVKCFAMLNSHEVLYPIVSKNKLVVLDLKESSQKQFDFHFNKMNQEVTFSVEFFMFPKTKLVCLKEQSENFTIEGIEKEVKLTYFNNSFDGKSIAEYTKSEKQEFKENIFPELSNCSKGNNHSMVIFQTKRQIFLFELKDTSKRSEGIVRNYENSFDQKFSYKFWQHSKDQLIISNGQRFEILDLNSAQTRTVDLQLSSSDVHTTYFCEDIIYFKKDIKISKKNIDLGSFILFNYDFQKKAEFRRKKCKSESNQICPLHHDTLIAIVDNSSLFSGNKQLEIIIMKAYEMKDVFMFLLENLNQDFDDDILFDALTIIDCL